MTDRAHMPEMPGVNVLCYEELIAAAGTILRGPCSTNNRRRVFAIPGHHGQPKGVLYAHRTTLLHTYAAMSADAFALTSCDSVLPVVPMFHVNAWGLPYICAATGAKLVLPGHGTRRRKSLPAV